MVWKKSEAENTPITPTPSVPRPRNEPRGSVATIGPSISIRGDLSGKEDLLIQGRVEGNIQLKQNNVTVGQEGRVKADIHGRSIRVEGDVKGNLYGDEDVVIRQSGSVQGNILAPRVTLENGSKFKGSIDMEPSAPAKAAPSKSDQSKSAQSKPAESKPAQSKLAQSKLAQSKPDHTAKPNGAPKEDAAAVTVPPEAAQAGLELDKSSART